MLFRSSIMKNLSSGWLAYNVSLSGDKVTLRTYVVLRSVPGNEPVTRLPFWVCSVVEWRRVYHLTVTPPSETYAFVHALLLPLPNYT